MHFFSSWHHTRDTKTGLLGSVGDMLLLFFCEDDVDDVVGVVGVDVVDVVVARLVLVRVFSVRWFFFSSVQKTIGVLGFLQSYVFFSIAS